MPCLAEQDEDGSRWLLTPHAHADIIPTALWHRARREGADGILFVHPEHRFTALLRDGIEEHGRDLPDTTTYLTHTPRATFDGPPTAQDVETDLSYAPEAQRNSFVHLHTHSEYSPLDGLSRMDEIVHEVTSHGQTAVAITDHGTCAGHPALQRAADAAGIKPIFGIEAYLCDDRLERPASGDSEAQARLRGDYWHLCLFAATDAGLRNLWAASTESFRDGFYHRPRMDWDTLARHRDGIIASTGCLRGPVAVALADGDDTLARARLTRLMDLYPGRLYVELQPNDMERQVRLNTQLVALAHEYGLPLLATVDSHFPTRADAHAHDVWIACQTKKDVQDEADLFAEDLNLYVMGEEEVRAGLAYLGVGVVDEAIANTRRLAERCTARIAGETTTPSFTGDPQEDVRRLHELCTSNWDRLPTGTPEEQEIYTRRYQQEMDLLVEKGFCGYYLMVADYTGWAKDNGILVGPGRGSGGGSLVAYLARITSLDPIRHDLLFERFLTRGREGLPDFDVDFPASKKAQILAYLRQRWGAEQVVSIGSELRLKNKAVVNELGRTLASQLPPEAAADLRQVCALIDEAEAGTAGLGMSWEELWLQHAEQLQPYADRYPAVFSMAEHLVGRLKSYGRHAAGVVISTGAPLTTWLPMRTIDGEEQMVTQWAMGDVEAIGLVKFDILTLRTLDTIQGTLDLIHEQHQVTLDLEAWEDEFTDPLVWDELRAAHTLGVFQVETHSGTRLTERMRPHGVAELADMVTLVRPGPMNSGLTDAYLRRRAGEQTVTYPDPRLEAVLSPTYGAMIYQEQVMAVTRILAGYDESEADSVRKILGKKKVSAIDAAGEEFLSRADMPRDAAARLWAQMAEFSKYGFNKSHAYAYAYLAYWTAFLKVNWPRAFLTAAMSTVDKDRVPDFVQEARRLQVAVLPPDINTSRTGFRPDPTHYAVRYGLDSIKGIGTAAVNDLTLAQPYSSYDDFTARKGPKANAGVVALLARVGAFDSLVPNRRGLEAKLLAVKTGADARCAHKTDVAEGLPCAFDWSTEPPPVNARTGKRLAPKPPPKRCTKACRQYTPRPALRIDDVAPYTAADIRDIEQEMLGVHLTSTPFDDLDPADREACARNAQALVTGSEGTYIVAAIITSVRPHRSKPMGFLGLKTETSTLSAAVFRDAWEAERRRLAPGRFCLVQLRKNARGLNLLSYQPL